jgi:hypothetical protein
MSKSSATHPPLPPNALRGVRLGVSVSESSDLPRLGLTEGHFRLALGEITRSALVLGGMLAYGGHLDPTGYTAFLSTELKRYARRDRPLLVCLAWSEHRRKRLSELDAASRDLGLYGSIICLDVDGNPVQPDSGRTEDPVPEANAGVVARGLTSLRHFMTRETRGRVLLGGKRSGFQGAMPGLLEEAKIALEADQPLFMAGGFGGMTLDIIQAVEPAFAAWLPAFTPAAAPDPRCKKPLEEVAALAKGQGWRRFNNGLTENECRRLAATHRPSEVASLVSLGLGRLAGRTGAP